MVALGASVSASAKVAWTYLVNAGSLGGISSVTPTVRNALRSVRARIFQRGEGDVATSVQRPSAEFAGVEEERMVPRLVFGGAPSLQEAKDATNELKDALDKYSHCTSISNSNHY
uniref:Uncharacterized protein LOC105142358 isoform X3 n=1 Tax=Rhizophora mucronata TaxID=61149 RepID=A0A2P2K2S6_RHIMU